MEDKQNENKIPNSKQTLLQLIKNILKTPNQNILKTIMFIFNFYFTSLYSGLSNMVYNFLSWPGS